MADVQSETPETGKIQPDVSQKQEVHLSCRAALLARTDQLIAHIRPDARSIERRICIATYVADLIMKCFQNDVLGSTVKAFMFGSVPLRTFLPDGDIDLSIFCEAWSLRETWANQLQIVLEQEQKNGKSPFKIGEVVVINAEVKLLKCIVDNIVVDISYNQLGGLCTLNFLEKIDIMIAKQHLFKRSIMLVKAWCYYESRVLGAHHGLISTYALETLVLYIFNLHHRSLNSPLEVLHKFLVEFSEFDWDKNCLTLQGPVANEGINEPVRVPDPRVVDPLLSEDYTLQILQEYGHQQLSANKQEDKKFPAKCLNIMDPLLPTNNLGRSVGKANFSRIRRAFHHAAQVLQGIFAKEDDVAAVKALDAFFKKTWEAQRRRQPQIIPTDNDQTQHNMDAINAAAAVMAAAVAVSSGVQSTQSALAYDPNSRTGHVEVPGPSSTTMPIPQAMSAPSLSAPMSTPIPPPMLLPAPHIPPGRSMSPQIPLSGPPPRSSSTPPPTALPLHPMHMPIPAFGRFPIEATLNHGMMLPGQQPPPPPPARVATPPPYALSTPPDLSAIRPALDQHLLGMSAEHIQQLAHAAASLATNSAHIEPATFQHLQAIAVNLAGIGGLRPPPLNMLSTAGPAPPSGPPTSTPHPTPSNRQHQSQPMPPPSQPWPTPPLTTAYLSGSKPGPNSSAPLTTSSLSSVSAGMSRVHSFDSIPNMLTMQLLNAAPPSGRVPPHFPGYIQAVKQQSDVYAHSVARSQSGNSQGQAGLQAREMPLHQANQALTPRGGPEPGARVLRESSSLKQLPQHQQQSQQHQQHQQQGEGEREDFRQRVDSLPQAHSAPANFPIAPTPLNMDGTEREGSRERELLSASGAKPQGAWASAPHIARRSSTLHMDPSNMQPNVSSMQANVSNFQGNDSNLQTNSSRAGPRADQPNPWQNSQHSAANNNTTSISSDWESQDSGPGLTRRQASSNPIDDLSTSMSNTSINEQSHSSNHHHSQYHHQRGRHSNDPNFASNRNSRESQQRERDTMQQQMSQRERDLMQQQISQQPMVPPGLEPGMVKRMVHHRPSSSHDDVFQLMHAQMQNNHAQNAQISMHAQNSQLQRDSQALPGGQKLMPAWPGMLPPGAVLLPGPGAMLPMMPPHSMPSHANSDPNSAGPGARITGPPRRSDAQAPPPVLSFGAIPMAPGHFPYGIPGPGPGDMQPGPGPGGFGPIPLGPGPPLPSHSGPSSSSSGPGPIPTPGISGSGGPNPSHQLPMPPMHLPGPVGSIPPMGSMPPSSMLTPNSSSSQQPESSHPSSHQYGHSIHGPLRPATAASPEPSSISISEPLPIPFLNAGALSLIANQLQTSGNPDWLMDYQRMCMFLSQQFSASSLSNSVPGHGPPRHGPPSNMPSSQAIAQVLSAMNFPPNANHAIPQNQNKPPSTNPPGSRPVHDTPLMPNPSAAPNPLIRTQAPPHSAPFTRHAGSIPSLPTHPPPSQMPPAPPPGSHTMTQMTQMQLMSAFAKMAGYASAGPDMFGMSPPSTHMSHLPPIPAPAAAPVHHSPPSWLPMHALELHHQHLHQARQRDLMSADLDSLHQEFTTAKSAIMKSQTRRSSTNDLPHQPEPHNSGPSSLTATISKPASDVDDTAGSDSWLDDTFRMSAGDASPKLSSDQSRLDSGSDLTHADAGSHASSDTMIPPMLPPSMPPLPLPTMLPGSHPGSLPADSLPHPANMLPFPHIPPFPVPFPPPPNPDARLPIPPLQDALRDSSLLLPMFNKMHPHPMPNTSKPTSDLDEDPRGRDTPTSASSSDIMHSARHASPPPRALHLSSSTGRDRERDPDSRGYSSREREPDSHGYSSRGDVSKDAGPSRRSSSGRELPEYSSWEHERELDRERSREGDADPPGIHSGDANAWDGRPSSSRDHSSSSKDPPGISGRSDGAGSSLTDPPGIHHQHSLTRHSNLTPIRASHPEPPEVTTPSPSGAAEPVSRSSSSLSGELDMPPGLAAPAAGSSSGPPGLSRSTPSYPEIVSSPPSTGERTPKTSRSGSEGVKAALGSRLVANAFRAIRKDPPKVSGSKTPGSGGKPALAAKPEVTSSSEAATPLIAAGAHLSPGRLQQKQVS